jgi:hypothetical protein
MLAAVLALGSLALAGGKADASGFGLGNGTYGISPGSFSVGVGFNVAWSGLSFGRMDGGGGGAPCYGPPAGPQMYDAYGHGGNYGSGHYGYQGYYGGYPAQGYYGGYPAGGYYSGPANAAPAGPAAAPKAPVNPGQGGR